MGLTRTNIYLDDRQLERLRAKSDDDHVPVSELVRRAVDVYLAWGDPTYQPTSQPPLEPQTKKSHSSPP
jgi:hypothetical protein